MTYENLTTNQKHLMDLAFTRYKEGKGYRKRPIPPIIYDLDFDNENDKKLEDDFNWLLNNDLIHVEHDFRNQLLYCLSDIGLEVMLGKRSL